LVIATQHIDARLLQCAKQTPFPGRFVVLAFTIIGAIPSRRIAQKTFRTNERSRKEVELTILGTEATAEPYIAATNLFGPVVNRE